MEKLLKLLTETIGEDEAKKITESLETYKKGLESSVQKKIAEGIKEKTIVLEADYLQKLETAKEEADKSLKKEVTVYEKQLASRVKSVLEQAIDAHGNRLASIEEAASAKRGSALLQEVEALVSKARAEINEKVTVKPEDYQKVLADNKALKEALEASKKSVLEHKARANVAESELKNIRESLETNISVTVETEDLKGTPAAIEHPDVSGKQQVNESVIKEDQKPRYSPEMARMRRMAGLK